MFCEKKNRPLMFSVDRKIQSLGSTLPVRIGNKASWTMCPRAGIFLFPLNSNDGFYLSGIQEKNLLQRYQLSSVSSPYVMALRVYIFENKRMSLLHILTCASVQSQKHLSVIYLFFFSSGRDGLLIAPRVVHLSAS